MLDSFRFINPVKNKLKVIYTITYSLIFLVLLHVDSNKSHVSVRFSVSNTTSSSSPAQLQCQHATPEMSIQRPGLQIKLRELGFIQPPEMVENFDSRVRDFFKRNSCRLQIFMTWISSVDSFGDREFVGLETPFNSNPKGCVIILSKTLDSPQGLEVLNPLIARGFRIQAMNPNLSQLLNSTPAECWLEEIGAGIRDPGRIPLEQNLSNLIRLAALYKYGGVYLDTDFIILRDISSLRNSIAAQSVDINGNWTRLNNAVLIFDRNHPILLKFMEEFALTFNGNIWGHNGPYLVSRVVNRTLEEEEGYYLRIMGPMAFYPVDWNGIVGYFGRPRDRKGQKWVRSTVRQLRRGSNGVHLWNSKSKGFRIEEGSVVGRLMAHNCVICTRNVSSDS